MEYSCRIVSTARGLRDFIRLPYLVYNSDPYWVTPMQSEVKRILNTRVNPYFHKAFLSLFICYQGKDICSRAAVIINPDYHKKYDIKNAFFGFFESVNDPAAVSVLFEKIERYCRFHNINILEGPFNPNHYSELGLQADNLRRIPTFFQPYNPPYYCEMLEKLGFAVSKKVHTRKNEQIKKYIDKKYADLSTDPTNGFKIRPFRRRYWQEDLDHLREVFNDAFRNNWHFIPVSRPEYHFSAKYLNMVTTPDLIQFIEYEHKPIAAIQFVLDINPLLKKFSGRFNLYRYLEFKRNFKHINKLIIFAVGIKTEFRKTDAFKLILRTTVKIARNFDVLETTWISDNNTTAVGAAECLGLKPDRKIVIYAKNIEY